MSRIFLGVVAALLLGSLLVSDSFAIRPSPQQWTPPAHSGGGDDDDPLKVGQKPVATTRDHQTRDVEFGLPISGRHEKTTWNIVQRATIKLRWVLQFKASK